LQGSLGNYDNGTLENIVQSKPLYLAALTENNLPGDTWGPRRRIHQYGPYAHLLVKTTNNNMPSQRNHSEQSPISTNRTDAATGITNPTFDRDSTASYDDEYYRHRF